MFFLINDAKYNKNNTKTRKGKLFIEWTGIIRDTCLISCCDFEYDYHSHFALC